MVFFMLTRVLFLFFLFTSVSYAGSDVDAPAVDVHDKVSELERRIAALETQNQALTDTRHPTAPADASPQMPQDKEMAQYNQALGLFNKKEYAAALRAFDYFLTHFSDHRLCDSAYFYKAMCYFEQGPQKYIEAKDALHLAKQILAAKATPSTHTPDILMALAEISFYDNDIKKTKTLLHTFDKIKPEYLSDLQKTKRADLQNRITEKYPEHEEIKDKIQSTSRESIKKKASEPATTPQV